jgi:microcystin degradation protein MlrC
MRVAIGGIGHESSTFTPVPTTRADFEKRTGICRNDAILQRFAGSNTPIGGFIDRANEQQDDLMPLLYTHAFPSGVASRKTYSDLKDELLEHLVKALPVDGVFLDQHGAMVVEDIDDADGDLIEAVRSIVGPNCPIAVSYDLHSNHTPERIAAANLSIGFETFPHIDMAERGHEASVLLGRTNRGEIRPPFSSRVNSTVLACPAPDKWRSALDGGS